MDGEDIAERLGVLSEQLKHTLFRLEQLQVNLDKHIAGEEKRLKGIEEQLSFGRFLLFTLKALGLSVVFILTMHWNDLIHLWRDIGK